MGPLLDILIGYKKWSQSLLGGVFLRAVTNMGLHRHILHLIRVPPFTDVALTNPRFALKYLFPNYLVKSFTVAERVSCFVHHHSRMRAVLPDSVLRQVLFGQTTLHEIPCPDHSLAITMGLSKPCDKEGEFSVNLLFNGEIIYTLSFTIAPSRVVLRGTVALSGDSLLSGDATPSADAELLLITRIQGAPGSYEKIKSAVKIMHDTGPDAALFAAAQGIAAALRIDTVAAVSATNQSSNEENCAASFKRSYDDFYNGLGLNELPNGFFFATIPVEGKPLSLIRRSHRQRTKEQRRIKQAIYSACADSVLRLMNPAAPARPSPHSTPSAFGEHLEASNPASARCPQ